ncbi:MAG TPA: hypothetical protein VFE48_22375 [Methylomirabilota bacterium]|nr:hypothetical protein [Methylomirabilota bacterium]
MNQRQIDEQNARVLAEAGFEVRKDITGDMSATRESLTADDRQPMAAESIRVGDARILSQRVLQNPNMTRTYSDISGTQVSGPDAFLHGQAPKYIGGQEIVDNGDFVGSNRTPGHYVFDEPNVDRRDEAKFPGERGESGIAPAGTFRPATPGLVGGREPGSYVVKAADTVKKGTFRSVLEDKSNASGHGEQL